MPLLRERLQWILQQSSAAARSHAHRAARAIFNQLPKRELFYTDAVALKPIIDGMVRLTGDTEVAVASRRGAGYLALQVAFQKSRYSQRVAERLTTVFSTTIGPVSFHAWADCSDTAFLMFYFRDSTLIGAPDLQRVEEQVRAAVTTWEDRTAAALESALGSSEGRRLFHRYVRAEDLQVRDEVSMPLALPAGVAFCSDCASRRRRPPSSDCCRTVRPGSR